jgi:hypothetical protein
MDGDSGIRKLAMIEYTRRFAERSAQSDSHVNSPEETSRDQLRGDHYPPGAPEAGGKRSSTTALPSTRRRVVISFARLSRKNRH